MHHLQKAKFRMRRAVLITSLLIPLLLLNGLTAWPLQGDRTVEIPASEPCRLAEDPDPLRNRNQRKQGTISYEYLESILAKYPERYNASMGNTYPGPPVGELVVVFAVTEPDGYGGRKINNPTGQAAFDHLSSIDRLTISEYGLIYVPWIAIMDNGLPDLPIESTSATFVCKPLSATS